MQPETARALLTLQLDATLGRWVITAKERAMLTALRAYVQSMTPDELTRLSAFLPATLGGTAASAEEVP